jgi:hypothetical protein
MQISKRVIGIGGAATAGKDTFASILIKKLEERGHIVKRIALADALKGDCDEFCRKTLEISAFTQIPEEKLLIRPLLVWYGDAQRKRTNGQYWINIAQRKIDITNADYFVVTDVRYDHYEKDEVSWIKDDCHGYLCHISKWTLDNGKISFVPTANDHEALNDPKVKAKANYTVAWPDVSTILNGNSLLEDPTINGYVEDFISAQDRFFG